ncbi:MAG: hypothetical protein KBT27_01990, partial [Prevotellaceae bacterium]|nr:hypothetical protein [Candidatus Faecinaster equi]
DYAVTSLKIGLPTYHRYQANRPAVIIPLEKSKKYRWAGHAYLWHYSTTSHSPRPQNLLHLAA